MRKLILHVWALLCLLPSLTSAQPGNPSYVPGTQVCWTFNGRPHGYFKAAGNGERHILISFTGVGENVCHELDDLAPQKLLNDTGTNWNGRTVRAPGDIIVWEVFTLLHTNGFSSGTYAADIKKFFDSIKAHSPIDTSDHTKFHIQGLSAGANNLWLYLSNNASHNSPYRHIFGTTITMGCPDFIEGYKANITPASVGRRHWVWHGANDTHKDCPPSASDTLYAYLTGDKRLTMQAGGRHNHTTWDSCLSLRGTTVNTNRWLWMVANGSQPPVSWGPPGYVPGTQVCWTFNNRPPWIFQSGR